MGENHLYSRTHKKYVPTTDSDHDYSIAENFLQRNFHGDRSNEKMVTDTMEIATDEGKIYVAGIFDRYGRLPVGLSIRIRNDRCLVMGRVERYAAKGVWKRRLYPSLTQGINIVL